MDIRKTGLLTPKIQTQTTPLCPDWDVCANIFTDWLVSPDEQRAAQTQAADTAALDSNRLRTAGAAK